MLALAACTGLLFLAGCDEELRVRAELEAEPTILDFVDVAVGYPAVQLLQVKNLGNGALTLETGIEGGDASPFSVIGAQVVDLSTGEPGEFTEQVPGTVGPGGGTVLLHVQYDPQSETAEDFDALVLHTNDRDECPSDRNPCRIQLNGTGAPPDPELEVVCQEEGNCPPPSESRLCWVVLDPATNTHPVRLVFDYCELPQGQVLDRQALLKNVGNVPLELDGFELLPNIGELEDFSLREPGESGVAIPPGGEAMLTVRYQPSNAGVDNVTMALDVNDDDIPGNQFDVSCMAQSLEPNIDVNPENIPFQGVTQGASDTKPITVHNKGTGTLVISGLEVTGGTVAGEFSIDPTEGFDVLAGQQAQIQVTYSPQDAGQDDGAVIISSNDPDEPEVSVTLGADVRPDLEVTPPDVLEFLAVEQGGTETQDVSLRNVGYADLVISGLEFTVNPGDPAVFSLEGLPGDFPGNPIVLAPAEGIVIQVRFDDNTTIEDELGQLEIEHDSPNDSNPYILLIMNSGTPANLPPVAVIDPPSQTVHGLDPITLDGSGSFDPDAGDSVSRYLWSFLRRPRDPQGNESQAVLDTTDQPQTSFTPDIHGTYIVRLVVFDSHDAASQATDAEVSVAQ